MISGWRTTHSVVSNTKEHDPRPMKEQILLGTRTDDDDDAALVAVTGASSSEEVRDTTSSMTSTQPGKRQSSTEATRSVSASGRQRRVIFPTYRQNLNPTRHDPPSRQSEASTRGDSHAQSQSTGTVKVKVVDINTNKNLLHQIAKGGNKSKQQGKARDDDAITYWGVTKRGDNMVGSISRENRISIEKPNTTKHVSVSSDSPASSQPHDDHLTKRVQQTVPRQQSTPKSLTNPRPIISFSPSPNRPSVLAFSAPIATRQQPSRKPDALTTPKPIKSILRQSLRYAPPKRESALAKADSIESSVPSLVDIKEDSDDDDEDASRSSSDPDSGLCNTDDDMSPILTKSILPAPVVVTPPLKETQDETESDGATVTKASQQQAPRRICFDPKVWVREFHRTREEFTCTWYTDKDMDSFKKVALERVLRYHSTTEIIATGTGRTIQRTIPTWKGPIYSHAALTLDGENDNDAYMKKKVLEKELNRIMIVDPHDLCLELFSKTLKRALPRTAQIVTATSSQEVLKQLEQGKRFDVIIIEERLRLFHRQNAATSNSSSVAQKPQNLSGDRLMYSGAALIEALSRSEVTSNSLFVGVSAHMKEDESKLKRNGADFCWSKPPPPIDKDLLEEMVKAILVKRGKTLLATELYG